jgi:hypothetical protein
VTAPAVSPVIMPVLASTDATSVLLLLHIPPEVELVNVVVTPVQTEDDPDIEEGNAFTVIVAVADEAVGVVMHE